MTYLYGDSTPFPLTENFLVTLCAATEACAGVLRADVQAQRALEAVRRAETRGALEIERLEDTARAVHDALRLRLPDDDRTTPASAVARSILETTRGLVKDAQKEVAGWREAALAAAAGTSGPENVRAALAKFLCRHELPGTLWNLQWVADFHQKAARAEVYASSPGDIDAVFDVAIPGDRAWSRAVPVARLARRATIRMTRKRWLRAPSVCDEKLHRLHVVCVIHTRDYDRLVLARSPTEPSESVVLTLRTPDSDDVTVFRRDREGTVIGEAETLLVHDAETARRIWAPG